MTIGLVRNKGEPGSLFLLVILCAVFLESGVDMRQVARGARLTVAALNRVRRMATAYQDGCRSAEEN